MKTRLISTLSSWLVAGFVSLGGTADIYINDDNLTVPPQIDARAVLNRGTMQFFDLTLPFDTQNTRFFTNVGTLIGSGTGQGGFRLDHTDGVTGARTPADVINNLQGALLLGAPYLLLDATNIINRGTLQVTTDGLMRLSGQNVDVTSGKLDLGSIGDVLAGSDGSATRTNFTPSAGVTDLHWGTNFVNINAANFYKFKTNGVDVATPPYRVRPDGVITMQAVSPLAFVHTNFLGDDSLTATNTIVEAVFVVNGNTNISVDVSFFPSDEDGNPFNTFITKFSGFETNIITRQKNLRTISLIDFLASETNLLVANDTNLFLLTNSTTLRTFRPANFDIIRQNVSGLPANATVSSNLFTSFGSAQFTNGVAFSNKVTAGFYSAYKANVNSELTFGGNLPDADFTNFAGRLEINAANLNLQNARIRGGGVALVKAENLVSSANAQIDVPFLFYDLGATNGNLTLSHLAGSSLTRFASGPIQAWSAIWTNGVDVLTTNMTVDPGTMTTNTEVVSTNFTTMFHVLVVSAGLQAEAGQTEVTGIKANATNTTVADDLLVRSGFQLQSDTLTVNSRFLIGTAGSGAWNKDNAPNLKALTNNGIFSVNGVANYGRDRGNNLYSTVINRGTNTAVSISIGATNFVNSGTIASSGGPLDILAGSAQLEGSASKLIAQGDLYLTAADLKLRGASVNAFRSVQLEIANSLTDGGADSPNRVVSRFGFSLASKPAIATLLGTTFEVDSPAGGSADILWPANDLGATVAGFANNAAIGKLVLNADDDGIITVAGSSGGKALYVDFLEFSSAVAADLASHLMVADDVTIYFADSTLPAEQLDGALNGRLKWVREFAGPFSGVDVALTDGRTIRVNRNLFNSQQIDSDSDGIANAFDPTPFGGVPITTKVLDLPPLTVEIAWLGAPHTTYRVEATSSLTPAVWQSVTTVSNTSADSAPLTAQDALAPGQPARYYRVTYEP